MPNNNDTTPDLIFCTQNIRNDIVNIVFTTDLVCDHLSAILTIDTAKPITYSPPAEIMNYNRADVEQINYEINAFLDAHEESPITEEFIDNFNTTLTSIIAENTLKYKKNFFLHELLPFIMQQIKIKR